ncbi:MAG: CopG family transcriptional regulator [Trichlorobacter sp.]|nr:CopG family transcriptional regulator [Trichlorobacter sp.]
MQITVIKDTMPLRLQPVTRQRVEALAKATNRSATLVIEDAINSYLKLNEWQVHNILTGLQEVKSGETTPHAEVLTRWEAKASCG